MKKHIFTLPEGTELNGKIIKRLIDIHKGYLTNLSRLESYFTDEPIMTRKKNADLMVVNNFAKYITTLNVGHLLGNPVEYQATQGINIQPVLDAYRYQVMSDLDAEIAEDCSIFGRGYELVYLDENADVMSCRLDPGNTIVVYDNTFRRSKQFAIMYSPILDASGEMVEGEYDLIVWDKDNETKMRLKKDSCEVIESTPIVFGEVPVIEYANNRRFKGDFESVTSGIDAYNILQSDRVLDREKLIDAILVFYGANMTEEDRAKLKESKMMGLPSDAKAEYLVKNINEADAEVLRKSIASDIHKFSMTPDLSDEAFSGNSSGVAILYKLLAFEQNVKKKERYFEKGLMERFRLYAKVMNLKGKMTGLIGSRDVDAVFKRNLPKNDYETSQTINNLRGMIDDTLLAGQLSFVRDAKETVELAKKEADDLGSDDDMANNEISNENDTLTPINTK